MQINVDYTHVVSGLAIVGISAPIIIKAYGLLTDKTWNGKERRENDDYITAALCKERHLSIEKRLDEGNQTMKDINGNLAKLTITVEKFISAYKENQRHNGQ